MRTVNTRAKNGYITPMAAVRNKCLDCCCWVSKEVELCAATQCPLHPYRFGRNPKTTDFQPSTRPNLGDGPEGYLDTIEAVNA